MSNEEFKQYLTINKEKLSSLYDTNEAARLVQILTEHFLQVSTTDLVVKRDFALSVTSLEQFEEGLNELLTGKPIQHIIGEVEFLNVTIKVAPEVLIPRPETEELVHLCYSQHQYKSGLRVLDICSGSGCISIALSDLLENATVSGLDISPEALEIAQLNATQNKQSVTFERCDVMNDKIEGEFDIIISNPPYVLDSEKALMHKNVLDHEPSLALFVPDDEALIFYERILEICKTNLAKGGKVYLEINENKGPEMKALYASYFKTVDVVKDLFGKDRFLVAY